MPSKGREHFDTYTAQNRVKHAILTKYLRAYLQALSHAADAFHYIDGFAGPGEYESEHAGSPLYALSLLAAQKKPATASFVENDPTLFAQLEQIVDTAADSRKLLEAPWLRRAAFSDCIDEVLSRPALRRFASVATFAFVDPCGLTGLYVDDLAKILRQPYGEGLVFLNYDGLNRWIGAVSGGTHRRETLDKFFGSTAASAEALACVRPGASGLSREGCLLDVYLRAVRERSGAKFVLPFRFRATGRDRTSHYLIHLSQHALAFTIMKEVMKAESSAAGDYGSFEFIPADELVEQGEFFRPNAERARIDILDSLRQGPRPVRLFATEWPQRATDMLVSKEYKGILLDLEREGAIEVLDGRTHLPTPATKRRKRLGQPTLGDDHFVRLR